jgi:hypothetical protein
MHNFPVGKLQRQAFTLRFVLSFPAADTFLSDSRILILFLYPKPTSGSRSLMIFQLYGQGEVLNYYLFSFNNCMLDKSLPIYKLSMIMIINAILKSKGEGFGKFGLL